MNKVMSVAVLSGLLILGMVSMALAKEGWYVGLGIPYNTIGGDFDGSKYLSISPGTANAEAALLGKADSAMGFAISGGYGFTKEWAVDLDYLSSSHKGSWQGASGDMNYSVLDINAKYSFMATEPTQPYALVGISANTLIVKKGAQTSTKTDDATFTGTGFNLGGGVDHYINPNISVGAGLTYRIVSYDTYKGISNSGTLSSPVSSNTLSLMLSAAYHF